VPTTRLQVTVDPPVSPTFQTSGVIPARSAAAPATRRGGAADCGRRHTAVRPAGQTLDLVITGINTAFTNLSQVTFGPGLTVSGITPTDATHLTAHVSIARAPPSVRARRGVDRTQEGLLGSAFTVVSGTGVISGRLLSAQGQPIANAQVCLQGTTTCVTTGADGDSASVTAGGCASRSSSRPPATTGRRCRWR